MTKKLQVIYLILAAVIGQALVKAQLATRPDMKNLRTGRVLVNIDNPEAHHTQYHTADFDRRSYNYGYEVSPDGQFHHETRGPDGVTYGCYGYIDQSGILRATHYVADSQGYRTVEPSKPVLIYPNELYDNTLKFDGKQKRRGKTIDWQDLYFPIGCGMIKGGVPANVPLIKQTDGSYTTITRYSANAVGSSVSQTTNQPIQTEQFNGNQFNTYNSDSNSGQYSPTDGIGAIPLGSNVPTTYNPNYNEYQQQDFTDNVKDLHYEHAHGGHQTEFTITHGQSMSSGQQSGSGNSGGSQSGSGFGGHGIPHGGGGSPIMSGSNSQSSSSNSDGSGGSNYNEYHSSSSSSSSSSSASDGSSQSGGDSNFMGSQPGADSSFSHGVNGQPQQQQQSNGEQYGSSWSSGSNQYQHNPAPAAAGSGSNNNPPSEQSGQSSSGHSGSNQSSHSSSGQSGHINQHGSSFQHTHGHPGGHQGSQSGHGSSGSQSGSGHGSGGDPYYPQNHPGGSQQSGGMMSQSQGNGSGSQQGQYAQAGGNDPNNFQPTGSTNPPQQQQGGSGFSHSSQHGSQNQMSSGSSSSSSSSSGQSSGGNSGSYQMSSQGGSSGSNNGPYQNPVNGPHGQGFSLGHGHPVPQPGHGMIPSNSGGGDSQQPGRPMIPGGSDPHLPSRPMHSSGSESQGQTPNRPSGGDSPNQAPNRPSPPIGSNPSRPIQSGDGQIQPQTPNRPSGSDPQTQPPGRPTQTHPTRPGRPPVTQQVTTYPIVPGHHHSALGNTQESETSESSQQTSGQGSSQQSQQPTQSQPQPAQQSHHQPQQQHQGGSSSSNQNQQPLRPSTGGMPSGSGGTRPTYPPRPPPGSGTYFNGDDPPGAPAIGVHPPLEQQKPYTDSETPEPNFPFYNDPNYELAISRWPLYVVPLPLNFLQNALQGLVLGGCCGQQQQQANQENIQGSGQGQQSGGVPVGPSGNRPNTPSDSSSGSGSSQQSTQSSGSGNRPTQGQGQGHGQSQGQGQGQGQGQQSSQSNPSTSIQQMMQMNPNGGIVGFIPIVFFPCNGTQGNGNQYPYGMPIAPQGGNAGGCQPCANAAQQRSNQAFGAISNAQIFHNSDFNSVTQIRRTRQRKAKIDETIKTTTT